MTDFVLIQRIYKYSRVEADYSYCNPERLADQIWNVKPDAYVILEHFAPNNEEGT